MHIPTCADPITMSPQAPQPLAIQIGRAGTANQIVMVIERKLRVEKHSWCWSCHEKSYSISKPMQDFCVLCCRAGTAEVGMSTCFLQLAQQDTQAPAE